MPAVPVSEKVRQSSNVLGAVKLREYVAVPGGPCAPRSEVLLQVSAAYADPAASVNTVDVASSSVLITIASPYLDRGASQQATRVARSVPV
jgi:hypothetical protein